MSIGQRFNLPYVTVFDVASIGIPGALLFFYLSGTSTPTNTYSDQGLTVPNTNPVVANQAGQFPSIFLDPAITYKVVLTDRLDVQVWTADPVVDGIFSSDQLTFLQGGTGAVSRTAQNKMRDVINAKDFGATGAGSVDDTAAIQRAITYATSLGGGEVRLTSGVYLNSGLNLPTNVYLTGDDQGSTILQATAGTTVAVDASSGFIQGNGGTYRLNCGLRNLTILNTSATAAVGFRGKGFTKGCALENISIIGGAEGIDAEFCFLSAWENIECREMTGVGMNFYNECNMISTRLLKVQANGDEGIITNGNNGIIFDVDIEFPGKNGVRIDSGRAIKVQGYMEGLNPTVSGYAGVKVVNGDTIKVDDIFFDATQVVDGRDGSGTFVSIVGGTRVFFTWPGFASIGNTQTFCTIAAGAMYCEAYIPLGATFTNAEPSSRVYNEKQNELGVLVYNDAGVTQSIPGTNTPTTIIYKSTEYDAKAEYNTTTGVFSPKDYGEYLFTMCIGLSGLAAAGFIQPSLLDQTNTFLSGQAPRTYNGSAATAESPVVIASWSRFCTPGVAYVTRLAATNSAGAANTVANFENANLSIKRVG